MLTPAIAVPASAIEDDGSGTPDRARPRGKKTDSKGVRCRQKLPQRKLRMRRSALALRPTVPDGIADPRTPRPKPNFDFT